MAFSLPWNYTHILFTPKYQNSGITVLSDQARHSFPYTVHLPGPQANCSFWPSKVSIRFILSMTSLTELLLRESVLITSVIFALFTEMDEEGDNISMGLGVQNPLEG